MDESLNLSRLAPSRTAFGAVRNPFVLSLALLALALSTELRLPLGGVAVTPAELLSLLVLCTLPLRLRRNYPLLPISLVIGCIGSFCLSIMVADDPGLVMTAIRNLMLPLVFLLALMCSDIQVEEAKIVLWAFVIGAVLASLLALWQADVGVKSSFSLYNFGDLPDDKLQDVMSWKLSLAKTEDSFFGLQSIGFGFHYFSNNFGEFIVYGVAAVLALTAAGRVWIFALPVLGLLGMALAVSLSRTSWLGGALLIFVYLTFLRQNRVVRALAWTFLAAGVLLLFTGAGDFAAFDSGKTIGGRTDLNSIALGIISSGPIQNVFFGGLAGGYYRVAFSAPHSTALYSVLYFGLCGTFFLSFFIFGVTYKIWKTYNTTRPDDSKRSILLGGCLASIWFIFYGLTWTTIESSNSIFMWALFIGLGLSVSDWASRDGKTRNERSH
jgi:hypothetical protein